MASNAFITFFDKAEGESIQKGKEKWIELHGWDWGVSSNPTSTNGGSISAGKVNPGGLIFHHFFDSSSTLILSYLCAGKAFPKVELQMRKNTGKGTPETFFSLQIDSAIITMVTNTGTQEGEIMQRVEMIYKSVKIDYKQLDKITGSLGASKNFSWDFQSNRPSN